MICRTSKRHHDLGTRAVPACADRVFCNENPDPFGFLNSLWGDVGHSIGAERLLRMITQNMRDISGLDPRPVLKDRLQRTSDLIGVRSIRYLKDHQRQHRILITLILGIGGPLRA